MTLDRWDIELQALIDKFVASDGDLNPCPEYIWHLARHDMERLLSAQSCKSSYIKYHDIILILAQIQNRSNNTRTTAKVLRIIRKAYR